MPINELSINNLGSFIEFSTGDELKKYTLVFGTNGAGKSTLANLLHVLDNYRRKPGSESEQALTGC